MGQVLDRKSSPEPVGPRRPVDWAFFGIVLTANVAIAAGLLSGHGQQFVLWMLVLLVTNLACLTAKLYQVRADRNLGTWARESVQTHRVAWAVLTLVVLLLAATVAWNDMMVAAVRPSIESALENAGKAEMGAYLALPGRHMAGVKKYFVEDGPAYVNIERVVEEHALRRWVLTNPGNLHRYKILSVGRIIPLDFTSTRFEVHTTEVWRLPWYDLRAKKYARDYFESNEQTYTLVKAGGRWLVYSDQYQTKWSYPPLPPAPGHVM